MTFEELDLGFPNGFDDAELIDMAVNYQCRTATLRLSLRGNPPDSPNRDEYRAAALMLDGLYYLVIEPPDADHLWYPPRSIQIDGYPEDAAQFPIFADLKPKLAQGAFCAKFYVHDWNSFIHVAAAYARFLWDESGSPADIVASGP